MLKSIYIITICEYDYFTNQGEKSIKHESLSMAFIEFKNQRKGDFEFSDHWRQTRLEHKFVYIDEPHKQHGFINKFNSTVQSDIDFICSKDEVTSEFSLDVKNVIPSPEPDEEYVFDKDDYTF